MKTRRIAVSRLHLPDGTLLNNQVIELSDGIPQRHYPLVHELPATEWLGGDYVWPSPLGPKRSESEQHLPQRIESYLQLFYHRTAIP